MVPRCCVVMMLPLPWPPRPKAASLHGLSLFGDEHPTSMVPPSSTLPAGSVLAGKYRIVRELGRGGMAAVYEAVNLSIGKKVALKLLAGHLATSKTVVERFMREARAVATIRSPHICDVYDVGSVDDDAPFLVLELLEGESLYDAMVRDRQMSAQLTLSIILQLCRGLQLAHDADIVHRDLKPENVFLTVDVDGNLLVKILDFGLAKFYDPVETGKDGRHARLTREGAVFGTPAYMSPEQVRGQAAADTRADLWALACMTYECLTGATVWSTEDGVAMTFAQIATAGAPDPRVYRPDLPEAFFRWYNKALDKDIKKRFQTVREFADALAESFNYVSKGGGAESQLTHQMDYEPEVAPRPSLPPVPAPPGLAALAAVQSHGVAGRVEADSESSLQRVVSLADEGDAFGLLDRAERKRKTRLRAAVVVCFCFIASAAVLASRADVLPMPKVQTFAKRVEGLIASKQLASSGFELVAKHPWLPKLREAQVLVSLGQYDKALKMVRRLLEAHKHGALRNFQEQIVVAKRNASKNASCQITGISRPRRHDLLSGKKQSYRSGSPEIAFGIGGAVVAWVDAHEGQLSVHAVPLDAELRNRARSVNVTPEGVNVGRPSLVPFESRFSLSYFDRSGTSPGVYTRWLSNDAVIASPPRLVSSKAPGSYRSTMVRLADGGFAVAWVRRVDKESDDLFLRLYDKEFKSRGPSVRMTDYVAEGRLRPSIRRLAISSTKTDVHLIYSRSSGSNLDVRYQKYSITSRRPGLPSRPESAPDEARTLASELILTSSEKKANEPDVVCSKAGCFVCWQQAFSLGAWVGLVDYDTNKLLWHKRFSKKGRRPVLAAAPNGSVRLVWYEAGRILTAQLRPDGVGARTAFARVAGDHPPASVAAGSRAGEWYVAWQDYEAGIRESYVARIMCK